MAHSAAVDRMVDDEAVWETVVMAVADVTGKDPLSMEPLYEAVDPDALDALFVEDDTNRSRPHVTFTYCGCEVEVSADGGVRVETADGTKRTRGAA